MRPAGQYLAYEVGDERPDSWPGPRWCRTPPPSSLRWRCSWWWGRWSLSRWSLSWEDVVITLRNFFAPCTSVDELPGPTAKNIFYCKEKFFVEQNFPRFKHLSPSLICSTLWCCHYHQSSHVSSSSLGESPLDLRVDWRPWHHTGFWTQVVTIGKKTRARAIDRQRAN